MIQLDWPLEVSVGRSIAAAMLHFLLPLNSCWLWGEDDADCGVGGLPMKTTTDSGLEFESFPANMNVLRICPQLLFNVLNWRQNLQSMSNWKLLKCSEQGKLWNQESAEVVGFGLPLIYTRQRLPQTPHYTRPADWIRAVFPSMSSQFHQKYKKR